MTLIIISAVLLLLFVVLVFRTYLDIRKNRSTPFVTLFIGFLSLFGGLLSLASAL